MKRVISISMLLLFAVSINSQISISKSQGGPMEIERFGSYINKGSTLIREYITLNDETCPLRISPDVGVEPGFLTKNKLWFTASGNIFPQKPIAAYEIHHILYDVFGQHIKSLSNVEITDLETPKSLEKDEFFERHISWQAFEHEASEYFYCISYVANVRTMEGEIWEFNLSKIMLEMDIIQFPYEEDYLPLISLVE